MYIVYALGMVTIGFFAVIGLSSVISSIIESSFRKGGDMKLTISGLTPDNAEMKIRSAVGICRRHKIELVVICDEDDPAYDICALLQRDYPFTLTTEKRHALRHAFHTE